MSPDAMAADWCDAHCALYGRAVPKSTMRLDACVRHDVRTAGAGDLARTLHSLLPCASNFGKVAVLLVGPAPRGQLPDFPNLSISWHQRLDELIEATENEWLLLIESGVELKPWAVAELAEAVRTRADTDCLYGDAEVLGADGHATPKLKPAWSPILAVHYDYVGAAYFLRRTVLGAALRCSGRIDAWDFAEVHQSCGDVPSVGHVPAILSRMPAGRSARSGPLATWNEPVAPKQVSAIIPTRIADEPMLRRCIEGLLHATDYAALDITLVLNGECDKPSWLPDTVRCLRWDKPFNWSSVNNFGVPLAAGELLLFLNDDVEPSGDATWLSRLVATQNATGAGVVGPLLTYPDGGVQHVGIFLAYHGGGAEHLFHNATTLPVWAVCPREVSAVTGAVMLVPRRVFDAMGGFDPQFGLTCNDTDFCLRVRAAGGTVLVEPRSRLVHHERATRGKSEDVGDALRFWARWEPELRRGDPYFNPNLDSASPDWTPDLAFIDRHPARWNEPPRCTQ